MANPEHLEILKQGVEAWNHWMTTDNGDDDPDLSGATFLGEFLVGADFNCAILNDVTFSDCQLGTANFSFALLHGTNFLNASLTNSCFDQAALSWVNFTLAKLRGADFSHAHMGWSTFAANDLSEVRGLDSITHMGPSSIGMDTLYKSRGKVPEVFLRGCGLSESFIVQIPALVAAMQPIQFYSCFISYSSKDHDFADRLHADLQAKGVRVWFAPEDMKIGDRFRDRIDESIRLHDKLLLILSEHSVASQWVGDEVEAAFERERREQRTVLFPIQIDEAVTESATGWAAAIRRTRHIGDFRQWKSHDSYQKSFDRLLRDLKAEEKKA